MLPESYGGASQCMPTEIQYIIEIDLGGTTVRTGIFAADVTLADSVTFTTRISDGPMAVVSGMADSIRSLENRYEVAANSIGIGSPGPLDLNAGKLLQP